MEGFRALARVRHRQQSQDQTLSTGEMLVECRLIREPYGWLLCYTEVDPQEGQATEVRIALQDDQVVVERVGEASSQVRFRSQQETSMSYHVAGYDFSLAVRSSEVAWRVDPPHGSLCLRYLLCTPDGEQLEHAVDIVLERVEPMHRFCDGEALRASAWRLLCEQLGEGWGFVRWSDRQDELLVSDAGRACARLGVDPTKVQRHIERSGWRISTNEGLWRIDPATEVYREVLDEKPLSVDPEKSGWRDGVLGELQAICAMWLRSEPPKSTQALNEQTCTTIREAWKRMHGEPEGVRRWASDAAKHFAVCQREHVLCAQFACGVLLQHYLRRLGCEVLVEALDKPFA